MTDHEQPGRSVQERSVVLPVKDHRFASVHGHAHAQRPDRAPIFGKQCTLGCDGSDDGVRSGGKDGLHRIADGLEEDAVLRRDRLSEQSEVAFDSGSHRCAVPLPKRGAALDVGEEEGDSAAGILRHGRLRRCRVLSRVATRPVPAQRRVLKAPEESIVSVNDQPATSQHRAKFQPEDLLRQAQVQDVALSPDGSSVVYRRRVIADNAYRTHLWIVPWTGGDARQLTHAAVNDTRPVFSPDGRSLTFISDRGGREQPWILPLDGGELRLAVDIAGDARAVHWSPDGRRLLILAPSGVERLAVGDPKDPIARVIDDFAWRLDKSGLRNQLVSAWVASIDDGEARRLTDPAWEVLDARWLADGRHIAVVADAEPDAGMRRLSERAAAWRIAVDDSAEPASMAELPGGIAAVRPSPDGTRVAVVGKDYPRQPSWADNHLYVGDGTSLRRLGAALDRPVSNVTTGDLVVRGSVVSCEWLDDSTIVAQVGDEGRTVPFRFDAVSGEASPLIAGEIVCSAIVVAGKRIAMVASDRGRATEIYAVEDGAMHRLS